MSDEPPVPLPHQRFEGVTYDTFRGWATDPSLSTHERSGFPDHYREGAESAILDDIESKLPALRLAGVTVTDIGCGASPIAMLLRDRCADRGQKLTLVDSPEVLAQHRDGGPGVTKLAGRFPGLPEMPAPSDAVLAYSVLQYAFTDASVFAFVDAALALLLPGGRLLLGDVPNASMRHRFLASDAGRRHHREYTGKDEDPPPPPPGPPVGEIDDAVSLALIARARAAGYHAWILPQAPGLPMANRREDLVFERP